MRTIFVAGLAAALQFASPSQAATNIGFEDGSTTGWILNGNGGATTSVGGFTAAFGNWFGYVETAGQNDNQTLTQIFALSAGQTLKGKVGFSTTDYLPYNDRGFLRINGQNIFTASVASVGDFGSTGWQSWSFIAPTAGNYTLRLGVRNVTDDVGASYAVLDTAIVPEPGTWVMMIAGFAMVGLGARGRRRGVTSVTS